LKLRYAFQQVYIVLVTVGLIISAGFNFEQHTTIQKFQSQNGILLNDNFSSQTMEQLHQIVPKLGLSTIDYQPYLPTGGLNSANPRILAWGPYMDITFGIPESNTQMYTIREMNKKYIQNFGPWKAVKVETGQTYYVDTQPNHQNFFMFYKGATSVWVDVFPRGDFPIGLMSHLVPIQK